MGGAVGVEDVPALSSTNVISKDLIQAEARPQFEAVDLDRLALRSCGRASAERAGRGRPGLADAHSLVADDARVSVPPQVEVYFAHGSAGDARVPGKGDGNIRTAGNREEKPTKAAPEIAWNYSWFLPWLCFLKSALSTI